MTLGLIESFTLLYEACIQLAIRINFIVQFGFTNPDLKNLYLSVQLSFL